jgi:peptidoglycan hydrolase-like protein with peptidoglycan-binding domain
VRRRSPIVASILAAVSVLASGVALAPAAPAAAAPAGDDEVVAFLVRGVGNGHGRGMSQWGAYGRAVNGGQTWQQILDTYYGGTASGTRTMPSFTVRLTGWDGSAVFGAMSTTPGGVRWNGQAYTSMYARETSSGTFTVYGSTSRACPSGVGLAIPEQVLVRGATGTAVQQMQTFLVSFGHDPGPIDGIFGAMTESALRSFQSAHGLNPDGEWREPEWTKAKQISGGATGANWVQIGTAAGSVTFTTVVDAATAAGGDALGACRLDGSVTHYRGSLAIVDTGDGNRVVNTLDIEQYLRGVVPKEVSASWGSAGGGAGMHALRAQAVAARSYAMSQNRYSYARTCDTSSCQVYGGSGQRASASASGYIAVEYALTNQAIADTASTVRIQDGAVVSTEFSASNGPRTAGGSFPPVDDPWDDVPGNPNHRWTRLISADALASWCGAASATGIGTERNPSSVFDGIWSNRLVNCPASSNPLSLRNAMRYPTQGFDLVPITRGATTGAMFSFIGDSVGESVSGAAGSPLRVLLDGVFASSTFDSRVSRRTAGGTVPDGVGAAAAVPAGTDVAVVALGYNDDRDEMPGRIDDVMEALVARGVERVAWVTLSERRSEFAAANAAIAAARSRWDQLVVFDWNAASSHTAADRWFSDDVHLTATGRVEYSVFLRDRILEVAAEGYTPSRPLLPGRPLRVPVAAAPEVSASAGVPGDGSAVGVALNVTAVGPSGPGWLRVWPCGEPEPETSSVNWVAAGAVEPNAVVVPVDATGEICVQTLSTTDVLVDVSGWFDAGLRGGSGRLVDTREDAVARSVVPGSVLRVPVVGRAGVPDDGSAVGVALNVTAVGPSGPGWLRVWSCDEPEPETSSVNWVAAGAVEPNAVVVPVGASGEVCVSTLTPTEVLVDVSGWFDAGLRGGSGRLVDTREDAVARSVVPGSVLRVPVVGRAGVPDDGSAVGVALNVTAVGPSGPGWLRVWSCDEPEPETSSVNWVAAGAVEPNAVVVPVGASGEVCVSTLTPTEVLVDVSGWFDAGLRSASGRLVDTRIGLGPIPAR